jgi:hypothetical protein
MKGPHIREAGFPSVDDVCDEGRLLWGNLEDGWQPGLFRWGPMQAGRITLLLAEVSLTMSPTLTSAFLPFPIYYHLTAPFFFFFFFLTSHAGNSSPSVTILLSSACTTVVVVPRP